MKRLGRSLGYLYSRAQYMTPHVEVTKVIGNVTQGIYIEYNTRFHMTSVAFRRATYVASISLSSFLLVETAIPCPPFFLFKGHVL